MSDALDTFFGHVELRFNKAFNLFLIMSLSNAFGNKIYFWTHFDNKMK